jgi:hypothetical protein
MGPMNWIIESRMGDCLWDLSLGQRTGMSVICLLLGGVVRTRLYGIYAHLCNHIQKWWWHLGHRSQWYTVRGPSVGSGSRDVNA